METQSQAPKTLTVIASASSQADTSTQSTEVRYSHLPVLGNFEATSSNGHHGVHDFAREMEVRKLRSLVDAATHYATASLNAWQEARLIASSLNLPPPTLPEAVHYMEYISRNIVNSGLNQNPSMLKMRRPPSRLNRKSPNQNHQKLFRLQKQMRKMTIN